MKKANSVSRETIDFYFVPPMVDYDDKTWEAYSCLSASKEFAEMAIQMTSDICDEHYHRPGGLDMWVIRSVLASGLWRLYTLGLYQRRLCPIKGLGSEEMIRDTDQVRWDQLARQLFLRNRRYESEMAA